MRIYNFERVKPGDRPTARQHNEILQAIEQLSRQVANLAPHSEENRLSFAVLDETIAPGETDKDSVPLFWNGASWAPNSNLRQTWGTDPQSGVYLTGERHVHYFDAPSGRRIPLPGLLMHLAKLDGELTFRGSATAPIHDGSGSDTGINVTVNDWWLLSPYQALPAGGWVLIWQQRESRTWFAFGLPALTTAVASPADTPVIVISPYKKLVRFTLGGTLTTSAATVSGTITHQYGDGVDNSTSIKLKNTETSSSGVYLFEGSSGAAGLAYHHAGENYVILTMECPA